MFKRKIFSACFFSMALLTLCGAEEVRVALIGSSACQGYNSKKPHLIYGWGEVLGKYFKPHVKILNFAKSGYSSKMFIDRGEWKKTLNSKPHYVFITIGANDSKKGAHRYTAPEKEYRQNINRFVKETREIGAVPVIVTINQSLMLNKTQDKAVFIKGKVFRKDREPYNKVLRDIAAKEGLICIDLARIQQRRMEVMGEAAAGKLYRFDPKKKRIDPSHTNLAGAEFLAEIIAGELKKSMCPLKKELK